MLGKYVRVRVTNPIHSVNNLFGFTYLLNYGLIEGKKRFDSVKYGAFIMGINHPVRTFDGRVIAYVEPGNGSEAFYVVAPKSMKFILNQIEDALAFYPAGDNCRVVCLYERSCGAIVYRFIGGGIRYLLIKNKRSSNWGFPKGHVERGETNEQTAIREVLEETGIHIKIIPGFSNKAEYTIHGNVEKSVTIYLAKTDDVQTTIQHEEIEDYMWLDFDKAISTLKFANDKNILRHARDYLIKTKVIEK